MKKVFIVGHAKSGSTLVASQLQKYFTISSLGKEPNMFDFRNGINDLSDFKKTDLDKYESSFKNSNKTLDANPWNIGENSAKLIHQYFPDSFIIICQRDPFKRILSQYEHYLRIKEMDEEPAYSLADLLSDEMLKNVKRIDQENYKNYGILSTFPPMPLELLSSSNCLKTFENFSKYFSKDKIYVFDLDEHKDEDDISRQLSIFLDESISFELKLMNSASNSPNADMRKLYRKFDFFNLRHTAPISVKETIKKIISLFFPQGRYMPSGADEELVKERIHEYKIKKISRK